MKTDLKQGENVSFSHTGSDLTKNHGAIRMARQGEPSENLGSSPAYKNKGMKTSPCNQRLVL